MGSGIIIVLFGIIMLVIGKRALRQNQSMINHGVTVTAEVTDVLISRDSDGDPRCSCHVRFTDEAGVVREGTMTGLRTDFAQHHPTGSPLRVVYDPRNPWLILAPGEAAERMRGSRICLGAGIAFIATGIIVTILSALASLTS